MRLAGSKDTHRTIHLVSLWVCMCISIHLCIYVHICMHIYKHTDTYTRAHNIHVCMSQEISTYANKQTRTHARTHTRIFPPPAAAQMSDSHEYATHTRTRTHTHGHTRTHTHTPSRHLTGQSDSSRQISEKSLHFDGQVSDSHRCDACE